MIMINHKYVTISAVSVYYGVIKIKIYARVECQREQEHSKEYNLVPIMGGKIHWINSSILHCAFRMSSLFSL